MAPKQSASGNEDEAALVHEEHVDGDNHDSDEDKSEEESDTDNPDNDDDSNDDEHADDVCGGAAVDADDDVSGSDDSSSEDKDNEEQDCNFCKCGAKTLPCDICSDLFCSDCATQRRWHKLHPDADHDSDEHAEAFDLAHLHICFSCHHKAMQDGAEHGYNDMF